MDSVARAARAYERAAADERGSFNLGNALYRQQQYDQARQRYESAAAMAHDPKAQAHAYHNLGNSMLELKKPEEAINAYKEALKRDPADEDTRYNLAYAQRLLRQQQQQQKNDPNKDQKDKEQQKKDQQQDQQKQDQQQDQQKKDQQQEQQQQQDQQQQKGQQDQQQAQQPREGQIDKRDAERILDALNRQEKDVQDRVRSKRRVAVRVPIEKDW
jgi:tetratricopeptide (TPR) repeat protein